MKLNKINLYLFTQIFKYFFLVLFIFLSVAWLLQITRLFTITNFMHISVLDIIFLSIYLIPNLVTVIIPFILIFGLLLTFIKLNRDNELIAILSLGMGLRPFRNTIMLFSLILLILFTLLNFYFSPKIYEKYKNHEYELRNTLDFNNMAFSNFLNLNKTTILDFKKKNNEYFDIFISFNDDKENIVYAKKGNILSTNNQYNFRLTDGFKISIDENQQIEKLEFLNYILNIDHKNISSSEVYDKNTLTIFEKSQAVTNEVLKQAEDKFDANGNEQELGINGFHSFRSYWQEHPDRDDAWKEEELGRIGEERFRREYDCEFLVFDETLISSLILTEMEGESPLVNMGQTRWYKKPTPQFTYAVALDPSMGTGGDNAAIQVFELPSYEQVAEWQHNTTAIPGQIRVLSDICSYITKETGNENGLYWSVENNGIGEAALIVINDFGEENIPGLFVSEPMRKGHVRKFRKGFNTTHGTKITACSRLKTMIENDKMIIHSKPFITELKNYVATGSSYQAKLGQTDDLISAALLAIRMMAVLKDWDPRIYNTFSQAEDIQDYEPPMPIFISTNY